MHKLNIVSLVLSCGLFAAGCGSSTSGGSTFSCDYKMTAGTTTIHECSEYNDLPAADQSAEESACTAETGTAGTGCSTSGSLGSCEVGTGTAASYTVFYYSDGGETASDAQTGCTAIGGTWTAG